MKAKTTTYEIKVLPDIGLGIINPTISSCFSSFIYDFIKQVKVFEDTENEILDISPNGEYIALVSKRQIDTRKGDYKHFTLKSLSTGETIYETKKYYVYTGVFSPKSNYAFMTAHQKRGFCVKTDGTLIMDCLPPYVAAGISAPFGNDLLFGSERKAQLYKFDFDDLNFSVLPIESKGCIYNLRTDSAANIYTTDTRFVTRKHNNDLNLCWETKHKRDEHNFCNVPSPFFINENLDLMIYSNDDKQGNYLCQRLSTGDEMMIQRKDSHGYFISSACLGDSTIDVLGYIFDLRTGETKRVFDDYCNILQW